MVPPPESDLDRHDAEIRYVDELVGTLLARLDALSTGRETIVVVTSDHGELFGEHGLAGHANSLYEPVLRVPLIVRAPSVIPPGTRIGDLVGLIDLFPTLVELLEIDVPDGLEGRSVAGVLRGEPLSPQPLFAEWKTQVAKIEGDTKWIVSPRSGKSVRFDLARDPEEQAGAEEGLTGGAVESLLAEHRRRSLAGDTPRAPAELDPRVRRRLRDLGYLD